MTLRWYEGGEVHQDSTALQRIYQSGGGGATTVATPRVPPGARSISNIAANLLVTPSLGVQNTWTVSFGLRSSAAAGTVFSFRKAGAEQCRIERTDSGGGIYELRLMRGATEIATTAESYDSSLWHFFEFQVTVRDGTDGAYELRHNESVVASLTGTGVDLADTASDGADVFGFAPDGLTDDVYILDDQGTVNNDFLGDSCVSAVLPDGDGDVTDWTTSTGATHFDLVNALAGYVSSDTNSEKELFDFAALPVTGLGAIFGVMLVPTCQMEALGSRTLKTVYRDVGDTEGDGPSFVVNGVSAVDYPIIIEEDPVTATAWIKAGIDDGQFGVEVVS
jgi:hypothetical protein